ncbi:MAG: hypothetical protein LN417_05930 [Candidatus Thermoplasmatota archaeon]|nr:hypothetical protein [Candidatus Thermoplasmatota archaeon]
MESIEDLEEKMGTEHVAGSAVSEERGLMSRSEIVMERLEVKQLSEAVASLWMDITSARLKMEEAEQIAEETKHRLDSLLERLMKAEKEGDR